MVIIVKWKQLLGHRITVSGEDLQKITACRLTNSSI
jgi:hypothetical protein